MTTDSNAGEGALQAPSLADRPEPENRQSRRRQHFDDGSRHTRISGAWAAVAVAVVLGVALIDFIVENTRSTRIDFFGVSGHIPVAVALLAAALTGAVVVLMVGVCRTAQLRLALRRGRRSAATKLVASQGQPSSEANEATDSRDVT